MQVAIELTETQKKQVFEATGAHVGELTGFVEKMEVAGSRDAALKVLRLNAVTAFEGKSLAEVAN